MFSKSEGNSIPLERAVPELLPNRTVYIRVVYSGTSNIAAGPGVLLSVPFLIQHNPRNINKQTSFPQLFIKVKTINKGGPETAFFSLPGFSTLLLLLQLKII